MKTSNVIGMTSLIGGLAMFGFKMLGDFMGKSGNLQTYNKKKAQDEPFKGLIDYLHEDNFEWVDSIPWPPIQAGVDYIITMPLWLLLVIIGGTFLIVGGILIKR
jgi:hypothetical protein